MILYFSATGNNKYIAEKIAEAAGDVAVSMEGRAEKDIQIKERECLGIVVPTYFLEMPPNVTAFLNGASFAVPSNAYVFGVVTYGSTSGASGAHLKKVLRSKGVALSALYSIITPDTWTPMYDLSDANAVKKTLAKTQAQLERTIGRIRAEEKGDFRTRQLPCFVTYFSDAAYQKARHTSHFRVEESCVGCGLCAKNCPASAIEMEEGKPSWRKDKCLVCLRCLHCCPKFSIQYEAKTAAHGQYSMENICAQRGEENEI